MADILQKHLRGTTRAAVEEDLEIGEIGINEAATQLELIAEKIAGGSYLHFPSLERLDDITASDSGASLIGVEDNSWTNMTGDQDLQAVLDDLDSIITGLAPLDDVLLKDGSVSLTADWAMGDVNFGLGVIPNQRLEIGSDDTSDRISIYHDNSDGYFKWDDGRLIFQSDEGTNSNAQIRIMGKGTGTGILEIYDEDDNEFLQLYSVGGEGSIHTAGSSPGNLNLQSAALANVTCFKNAGNGETKYLEIFGQYLGGTKDSIQIGVGLDSDQVASFKGCAGGYSLMAK